MAAEQIFVPFLKWAGGKRWLVAARPDLFKLYEERYIEPFLGSGAVYFYIRPKRAILSDLNADLIATYSAIRQSSCDVQRALANHAAQHSTDYYYQIRGRLTLDPVLRAARFIYLNRTCWNGLYRVNRKGQFNVPIGTKTAVLLDTDAFDQIGRLLSGAAIERRDFELTINEASEDDFIFVDPPYTVKHNHNGFIKYNENLFSWDDQVRLKDALIRADRRGARILMTNADHHSIRELYQGTFRLEQVTRASVLAGSSAARGKVTELIVRNW
jgi:DNA adenine methylase